MTRVEQINDWCTPDRVSPLSAQEAQLWLVSLEPSGEEVAIAQSFLSEDEQARAARFRFERDRKHYVVARGTLRWLLSAYLGIQPKRLQFQYNEAGKPSLIRLGGEPVLHFNVSHSHTLAAYAFTQLGELGIDIEYHREGVLAEKLADRFFAPVEAQDLASLPLEQQMDGFFRCWTRKEAFIKARGDGLSRALQSFVVSVRPEDPPAVKWCEDDPEVAQRWKLWPLTVPPGYSASLVAPSSVRTLSRFSFPGILSWKQEARSSP